MATVRQMLQKKSHGLVSIGPQATVYDALVLMAEHEIGALVVLDHGDLSGMFSERDYARRVMLSGRSSKDAQVAEVMTRRVVCVNLETSVDECMAIMTNRHVRHLPVLAGDQVAGLVSIGDVVKALLGEQQFLIERLERYITT
jgi:CBS domain-containing protein